MESIEGWIRLYIEMLGKGCWIRRPGMDIGPPVIYISGEYI
jgi:hypothetical protein